MKLRRTAQLLACMSLATCAQAGFVLEHAEDFRAASRLDPAFWTVETGFLRNREAQYYTDANLTLQGGALVIEARREQAANADYGKLGRGWRGAAPQSRYTSASIVSRRAFLYGRIEVVARSPGGAGAWPAIWLLHESEGRYGEIDIYESVGKHPDTAFAGVHYGRDPRTRQHRNVGKPVPGLVGGWHTHVLEWTPERIAIGVDGETIFTFDPALADTGGTDPLRRPMRLHVNLALGGNWGGPIDDTRLPARFEIRSVRIYRWDPNAPDVAPAPQMPAAAAVAAEADAPPSAPAAPRWGR